jgi:hypothetical protein
LSVIASEQGPSLVCVWIRIDRLVIANGVKQSAKRREVAKSNRGDLIARDKLRNLTLAFSKFAMVQKRKIMGNLDWNN